MFTWSCLPAGPTCVGFTRNIVLKQLTARNPVPCQESSMKLCLLLPRSLITLSSSFKKLRNPTQTMEWFVNRFPNTSGRLWIRQRRVREPDAPMGRSPSYQEPWEGTKGLPKSSVELSSVNRLHLRTRPTGTMGMLVLSATTLGRVCGIPIPP